MLFGALIAMINTHSQFVEAIQFGELGQNSNDYIIDIEVGDDRSTYYLGKYATDTIDGTPVTTGKLNFSGVPSSQIFIAKYDVNNQQSFIKTFKGTNSEGQMTISTSGEIYFAVEYIDTLVVDGQQLTTQFDGFGESSMAMGKFDAAGNLLWLKNVESKEAVPKDLILHNNKLYVLGLFEDRIYFENNLQDFNGGSGYDGFIVILDPSTGVPSNLKTIDDGYPEFANTHSNELIISGTFGDFGNNMRDVTFWDGQTFPVKLDVSNNNGLNPSNGFFMSLDDTLGINFIQHIEGNTQKQDFIIADNKIILTANNTDYFKINNDSIDGGKHLLVQLDVSTGNYLSSKECSRHLGNLDFDENTQIIYTIIGTGNSSVTYDGINLAGNPKVSVLATDIQGNIVDTIFRNGYSTVFARDIDAHDGKLVIGGGITGSANLSDTISLGNNLTIDGYNLFENGWFAVYDASGSTPSSIKKNNVLDGLIMYPNPTIDNINFSKNLDVVSIYDQQGKLILIEKNVSQMNVSDLNQGLYHIYVEKNNHIHMFKMIKK